MRETKATLLAKPIESYASRPFVLAILATVSLLLAIYSYAVRADWVFGARAVASAPEQRDTYTRFVMYLTMQRLLTYRDVNEGRLPRSLEEVGEDWSAAGITYRVLTNEVFELRAPPFDGSGRELALRSDRDARVFLGLGRGSIRAAPQGGGIAETGPMGGRTP